MGRLPAAHTTAARPLDLAGIGGGLTGHQAQQRRLTRSIIAYQGDFIVGIHGQVKVLEEQLPVGVRIGKVLNKKHDFSRVE
jgi:hypothetical protein